MSQAAHRPFRNSLLRAALVTALLLLVPLVAMRFTAEVNWDAMDFCLAGLLLFGTGVALDRVLCGTGSIAYRIAAAMALSGVLLLVWASLAVGLIGDEGNRANLMYAGVLGVALLGTIAARFEPSGMAAALMATALAQTLVAAFAALAGLGLPVNTPAEILLGNAPFVALFAGSAVLFRRAVRDR